MLLAIFASVALFTCTTFTSFNNIVGNADIEAQLPIWSIKFQNYPVASFAYAIIAKIMRRQSANSCLRIFNLSDSPDNQDPIFTTPNLEHYQSLSLRKEKLNQLY